MRFKEYDLKNKNMNDDAVCSIIVNDLNNIVNRGGTVVYSCYGWPYADPGKRFYKNLVKISLYYDRSFDKQPTFGMMDSVGFSTYIQSKRTKEQLKIFYKDNNDT